MYRSVDVKLLNILDLPMSGPVSPDAPSHTQPRSASSSTLQLTGQTTFDVMLLRTSNRNTPLDVTLTTVCFGCPDSHPEDKTAMKHQHMSIM